MYTSYHGCFDKGINNGDCQKYETGSHIDMDYQHRVVTPYMTNMLVDVLLRCTLPVMLIVVGRVPAWSSTCAGGGLLCQVRAECVHTRVSSCQQHAGTTMLVPAVFEAGGALVVPSHLPEKSLLFVCLCESALDARTNGAPQPECG